MEAAPSSECLWMLQTELSQRQGEQHVYSLLVYSLKETFGQPGCVKIEQMPAFHKIQLKKKKKATLYLTADVTATMGYARN